ncbi:Hypothetical protein SMAX5B_015345 [Scophthalmus maximus]|uniref:Uncharacterized protein n=1 Tax=Scophthalmus maximus TaxID=52904 RepID=A0A2U9C7K8_SCOMX|nr:Hypothetical protein SMAX5B_015345 [Scophthalmus maximus]
MYKAEVPCKDPNCTSIWWDESLLTEEAWRSVSVVGITLLKFNLAESEGLSQALPFLISHGQPTLAAMTHFLVGSERSQSAGLQCRAGVRSRD